ncbi:hypothetical protein MJ257_22275, partial [Paenibacillus timonensis]|uniref:hypothetical protein n=1 Tax=Paenibacillus timonensis TaxID=225915 RepID=UPI001F06EAA5
GFLIDFFLTSTIWRLPVCKALCMIIPFDKGAWAAHRATTRSAYVFVRFMCPILSSVFSRVCLRLAACGLIKRDNGAKRRATRFTQPFSLFNPQRSGYNNKSQISLAVPSLSQ